MIAAEHQIITGCRSCGATDLKPVLDLGVTPLADALLTGDRLQSPEDRYPLTVLFCPTCTLVQIRETVPPKVLFPDDYPYYSSFMDSLLDHSRRNVEGLIERLGLGASSLAVELASNDGYLLQYFQKAGVPVLGIDPSTGPAQAAIDKGIPTLIEFFDAAMARRLVSEGRQADVIVGNNVLAHVPDQNSFVEGMATLLAPNGLVSVEVPYVVDLIEHGEFDTIYHEHHCYFSVAALESLFGRHGLTLVDITHHPIHGGTIRVFFAHQGEASAAVHDFRRSEAERGVGDYSYYSGFATKVEKIREDLVALLTGIRAEGKRVAAYGAAAKGATMLNFSGIDHTVIDYVVDRNTHKQGLYMPGAHLEILPPERLVEDRPDYVLILAWNFAGEIISQQQAYLDTGGRFIVPVPSPRVVE
ncbi:MAG: class I SAM-dependent methyltransferase [Acidimicrobiia bacterium]